MWQAKDIHERGDFASHLVEMKRHSFYTNEFTKDVDAVFEAFPALAMFRLDRMLAAKVEKAELVSSSLGMR